MNPHVKYLDTVTDRFRSEYFFIGSIGKYVLKTCNTCYARDNEKEHVNPNPCPRCHYSDNWKINKDVG
jgi:hypothetical protein